MTKSRRITLRLEENQFLFLTERARQHELSIGAYIRGLLNSGVNDMTFREKFDTLMGIYQGTVIATGEFRKELADEVIPIIRFKLAMGPMDNLEIVTCPGPIRKVSGND